MKQASAPGKMVLLGDYAVLEGSSALVSAVDRRAVGVFDEAGPSTPVVDAVLARANSTARVKIDSSSFYQGEHKLGLGSSAAVSVITAALATGQGDETTLSIALEGHRDAAGGIGSGIDVACCFYGGVLVTKKQPTEVHMMPSGIRDLHLSVLFAGQSASTAHFVAACRASASWRRWISVLIPLTEEGIEAWLSQDAARFLSVVSRYGRAMASMGQEAGVPIATQKIASIMASAERLGGAAKPSGAGGGDIVVVFAREPGLGRRVAEESGATLLDLQIDHRGLVLHG